ncbi:hypothetical protein DIPPA_25495 [Diplonema papillatum]|nr:hypothetical protein DIPPA_25495 [Diplonema papillatum]
MEPATATSPGVRFNASPELTDTYDAKMERIRQLLANKPKQQLTTSVASPREKAARRLGLALPHASDSLHNQVHGQGRATSPSRSPLRQRTAKSATTPPPPPPSGGFESPSRRPYPTTTPAPPSTSPRLPTYEVGVPPSKKRAPPLAHEPSTLRPKQLTKTLTPPTPPHQIASTAQPRPVFPQDVSFTDTPPPPPATTSTTTTSILKNSPFNQPSAVYLAPRPPIVPTCSHLEPPRDIITEDSGRSSMLLSLKLQNDALKAAVHRYASEVAGQRVKERESLEFDYVRGRSMVEAEETFFRDYVRIEQAVALREKRWESRLVAEEDHLQAARREIAGLQEQLAHQQLHQEQQHQQLKAQELVSNRKRVKEESAERGQTMHSKDISFTKSAAPSEREVLLENRVSELQKDKIRSWAACLWEAAAFVEGKDPGFTSSWLLGCNKMTASNVWARQASARGDKGVLDSLIANENVASPASVLLLHAPAMGARNGAGTKIASVAEVDALRRENRWLWSEVNREPNQQILSVNPSDRTRNPGATRGSAGAGEISDARRRELIRVIWVLRDELQAVSEENAFFREQVKNSGNPAAAVSPARGAAGGFTQSSNLFEPDTPGARMLQSLKTEIECLQAENAALWADNHRLSQFPDEFIRTNRSIDADDDATKKGDTLTTKLGEGRDRYPTRHREVMTAFKAEIRVLRRENEKLRKQPPLPHTHLNRRDLTPPPGCPRGSALLAKQKPADFANLRATDLPVADLQAQSVILNSTPSAGGPVSGYISPVPPADGTAGSVGGSVKRSREASCPHCTGKGWGGPPVREVVAEVRNELNRMRVRWNADVDRHQKERRLWEKERDDLLLTLRVQKESLEKRSSRRKSSNEAPHLDAAQPAQESLEKRSSRRKLANEAPHLEATPSAQTLGRGSSRNPLLDMPTTHGHIDAAIYTTTPDVAEIGPAVDSQHPPSRPASQASHGSGASQKINDDFDTRAQRTVVQDRKTHCLASEAAGQYSAGVLPKDKDSDIDMREQRTVGQDHDPQDFTSEAARQGSAVSLRERASGHQFHPGANDHHRISINNNNDNHNDAAPDITDEQTNELAELLLQTVTGGTAITPEMLQSITSQALETDAPAVPAEGMEDFDVNLL